VASAGPEHPNVANAHTNIGVSLHLLGRHREALAAFDAAPALRRVRLGATHPLTANALNKAGRYLVDLGRYQEAEARLREAYVALEPRRKEEAKQWNTVLEQMVRLYRVTGREAEAKRYEAMRAGGTS
jgi:tetratricopeptide (TPR) repeat protein